MINIIKLFLVLWNEYSFLLSIDLRLIVKMCEQGIVPIKVAVCCYDLLAVSFDIFFLLILELYLKSRFY